MMKKIGKDISVIPLVIKNIYHLIVVGRKQ